MPDTAILTRRDTDALPVAELIRRERRPLPSYDLGGVNYRAWAVAVCGAEVAHRATDFARVERLLRLNIDRWTEPTCEQWGQFPHEAHAAAALNWLSHLQSHESDKHTPFDAKPRREWPAARRAAWLTRRRYLWAGVLKTVCAYRAARAPIDFPLVA